MRDGKIANRFKTQGWVWATPIVKDGILYFGDLNGYLYAVDEANLKQKWSTTSTEYPGGIRDSAVIAPVKNCTVNTSSLVLMGFGYQIILLIFYPSCQLLSR